eukprot:COSAG06_NODE_12048_length_1430_cov_1.114200_2_plen_208_part_00
MAQQLYSTTRKMPFQEDAASRGGAAFDSSFGCALDMDGLHWSRASGAAYVKAQRFAPSDLKADRRNYNVDAGDKMSLAKSVEHSQRVYSCFSSGSSRFGARHGYPTGPGPGAYFGDVSRVAMQLQGQAPVISAIGRNPLGVSRIGPQGPRKSSAFASAVPRTAPTPRLRPRTEPGGLGGGGFASLKEDAAHWRQRGGAGRFGRAPRK